MMSSRVIFMLLAAFAYLAIDHRMKLSPYVLDYVNRSELDLGVQLLVLFTVAVFEAAVIYVLLSVFVLAINYLRTGQWAMDPEEDEAMTRPSNPTTPIRRSQRLMSKRR